MKTRGGAQWASRWKLREWPKITKIVNNGSRDLKHGFVLWLFCGKLVDAFKLILAHLEI